MKRVFTKLELVNILAGNATSNKAEAQACGISFNSQEIIDDEIFIALKGEKRHGHDFVKDALNKGASLAIVEESNFLSDKDIADKIIVVKDSLAALSKLAETVRQEFTGPVVGVIGSVGKTTAKELLGSIASHFMKCTRSLKSFNNIIGVPFTICNADLKDKLWVLELGMNHKGELLELSKLAKPSVLLLTQIAPEHMEFFNSIDEVADAEFEALSNMQDNGALIISLEDEDAIDALPRNLNRWHRENIRIHTFGSADDNDLKISNFHHHLSDKTSGYVKSKFTLTHESQSVEISTSLIGEHNAKNFAASILTLRNMFPNISLIEIANVTDKIPPPPMRLNQIRTSNGTLIIDDTYNSSPLALSAAIDILSELKSSGLKVGLIIGDMLELGTEANHYHLEMVPKILTLNPTYSITYGPISKCISDELIKNKINSVHALTVDEVASLVKKDKVDVVLLKASRGIGLDKVVKLIT